MTKEQLFDIFSKNNGKNFIIKTNIAFGRGINGVGYESYNGYYLQEKTSYESEDGQSATIKEINDNFVLLDIKQTKRYPSTHYQVYLPIENIVSVVFIMESTNSVPSTIKKNPLFAKKKTAKV